MATIGSQSSSQTRITTGTDTTDDLILDTNVKGLVLKDALGNYWRITITIAGVIFTESLGTTKP